MNIRNSLKIICVGVMTLAFIATPLYAAPKEDKGNNGKQKANEQVHKPERKNGPQNSKSEKAPKSNKIKTVPVSRGRIIQKEKAASQAKALQPDTQRRLDRRMEHQSQKSEQEMIRNLKHSLQKLNLSNWSYHPRDDRGQGNMGRPDMLDPFGHDKDSDRMELYGNRGRVLREEIVVPEPEPPVEEPVPEPEPIPEPEPEPEPIPEPEPEPEPDDPIPEFPF